MDDLKMDQPKAKNHPGCPNGSGKSVAEMA
jgi:hypothetical protein